MTTELDRERSTELLLETYPEFQPAFNAHVTAWESDPRSLCSDFTSLGEFVMDEIAAGRLARLPALFEVVERLMREGTEEVQNAVATCFLENLLNSTPHRIPPESFVLLLGPESRKFCRAWDEFSGVKTPGV